MVTGGVEQLGDLIRNKENCICVKMFSYVCESQLVKQKVCVDVDRPAKALFRICSLT